MKIRYQLLYCLLIMLAQNLDAQDPGLSINQGNAITFDLSFGFALPGGDLKDRFGYASDVGGGLEFITKNGNWIIGVRGGYIFGNDVKEDVLISLRTPEGQIVGSNGVWANINLFERGIYTNLEFGKLIPLSKINTRSGLRVTFGVGVLQHKIRLQEDQQNFVPQISGDYAKGYDKLSNGISFTEFIGYQHLANNRLLNFFVGFEFVQGFTQSRRDWDFNLEAKDDTKRKDFISGIRMGWILPFYLNEDASNNVIY